MSFAALIPFVVLFVCFAALRMALTHAAFVALLTCTILSGTIFHATPDMWNAALLRTFEFLVEIGFILVGCFFFVEVAQKNKFLSSLADLVRSVSSDRVIQAVLVTFPMELMVEGSSGFGTPLLIIAPLLVALHFPIELCVLLPFLNLIIGIPFGALGTPIRLGFPTTEFSHDVVALMLPFVWIGPLLTAFFTWRFDPNADQTSSSHTKRMVWIILLSSVFACVSYTASKSGPEFPALAGGFVTFLFGIFTAAPFFGTQTLKQVFSHRRGILTYGALLFCLWIGKQIWMDQLIPHTHIRVFNPGFVFILFGLGITLLFHPHTLRENIERTLLRSRRTLFVFFCMTFTVQQLRNNGALETLTKNLPGIILTTGVPLIGWLGSVLIGTSTVANLLLSKVVDPLYYAPLAAGSAIGVQLAFQSIAALRSVLNDAISEKRIFQLLAPLSLSFVLILFLILSLYKMIHGYPL